LVNEIIDLWFKVYQGISDDFGMFLYLSGTVSLIMFLVAKAVEALRIFMRAATNSFVGEPYDSSACSCEKEDEEEDTDDEEDSLETQLDLDMERYQELLDKERELVCVWNEIGDALKDTPGWPKKDMSFVQKSVFAIADLKEKVSKAEAYKEKE